MGFTLDTGALIALSRKKRRAWRVVELAAKDGRALRAPAPILVEFWRGPVALGALSTLLDSGIAWIDTTPRLARLAGEALAVAGRGPSPVDAIVATVAALHGDVVITSDVTDFERLTRAYPGLRALGV